MSFIISIIGISLIFSEIQKRSKQVRLSSRLTTQIQLAVLTLFVLFHYFCSHELGRSLIIVIFVVLVFLFLPILHKVLETSITRGFHMILDEVILGIQSGKSLSQSLAESLRFRNPWEQTYWNDLIEILNKKMSIEQIPSRQKREIFEQIVQISNSQTKLVEQLQSLRSFEKKKVEFRRKSGAATQQIRLQTAILSVVFVFCCLFSIYRNGFFNSFKLVSISSALFLTGVFLQVWIMKSQKWEV